MPSLTEMLDYIEARLQAGTQGPFAVTEPKYWTEDDCCEIEDGDRCFHWQMHCAEPTRNLGTTNARNIAALLNAAPGIVAAGRELVDETRHDQPIVRVVRQRDMKALLTPLYDEMKRQEAQHGQD